MNDSMRELREAGVSIWLDDLSRPLLEGGEFEHLVREYGVTGATSNPTIFAKAIADTDRYDAQLQATLERGVSDPRELFFELALEDVRRAAALLRPAHDATRGADGFVSFEVTPDLAEDTDATVAQALDLWSRLDLPNVMIKVPATAAGVPAIEELTALGVNVNVTLLFSVGRYEQVMAAYLTGLERRAQNGEPLAGIASVASFFVSRIDSKADADLLPGSPLRGTVAISNAAHAYERHLHTFRGTRWDALRRRGAAMQRPLWASTGTKNPDYRDVLYVESLVAPGTINTMPAPTLHAFADHGHAGRRLEPRAEPVTGVDIDAIGSELEREGVEAFAESYRELLARIESRIPVLR